MLFQVKSYLMLQVLAQKSAKAVIAMMDLKSSSWE